MADDNGTKKNTKDSGSQVDDENPTGENEEGDDADSDEDEDADTEGDESDSDEDEDDEEESDDDSDVERLTKQLAKTRKEAAKYRTSARELREQLANAKGKDEVDALVSEFEGRIQTLEMDIMRGDIGRELGLPAVLAKRLVGTTEAELRADAEEVAKALPSTGRRGSLRGGLDGGTSDDDELPDDPKAIAAAIRKRH